MLTASPVWVESVYLVWVLEEMESWVTGLTDPVLSAWRGLCY